MRTTMETKLEAIGPAKAKFLLAMGSASQRPLSESTVDAYARQMSAGEWRKTHQGIALDVDGRLIDGQHRLSAIMKSGCTVRMPVTTGLPPESYEVLDSGRSRTMGDVLGNEVSHANVVAAATRMLALYETGLLFGKATVTTGALTRTQQLTAARRYIKHPLFLPCVQLRVPFARKATGNSWGAGLMFLIELYEEGMGQLLFQEIEDGVNLQEGNPVLALRNRYIRRAANGLKSPTGDAYPAFAYMWRAIVHGRSLQKIFVKNDIFTELEGIPPSMLTDLCP